MTSLTIGSEGERKQLDLRQRWDVDSLVVVNGGGGGSDGGKEETHNRGGWNCV